VEPVALETRRREELGLDLQVITSDRFTTASARKAGALRAPHALVPVPRQPTAPEPFQDAFPVAIDQLIILIGAASYHDPPLKDLEVLLSVMDQRRSSTSSSTL
jgi:hypothetical protein